MGSRIRNLRILEALAGTFDLTTITLVHDPAHLHAPGPIAGLGEWVPVLAPHRRGLLSRAYWHLAARRAERREGLWRETFFQSFPVLGETVARTLTRIRPHLVHVAYWYTLRHLPSLPRPPLWVVDTHDVQFERQEKLFGRHSERERRAEIAQLERFDRVIAITEEDRRSFRRVLRSDLPIEVIPMGLDLANWRRDRIEVPPTRQPRVLYYGNLSTGPNQIAARHLLHDLLPPLARAGVGFEALLLGASPPPDLRDTTCPFPLEVTGFVEDVRPWLASAAVFALSLRAGSGQRGRVLEALALGTPVVAYPEAIHGLDLAPGEGLLVAGSDVEFRDGLRGLIEDPARARELGEAGRAAVAGRYGWDATYGRFPRLYEQWLRESGFSETGVPAIG